MNRSEFLKFLGLGFLTSCIEEDMKVKQILGWWGGSAGNPLGIIYNESTFPDVADFTVNGSVTPTAGGGTINFTGGTDVFSNTLDLTDPYTMLENYTMRIRATITAGAKTGFTFGSRGQSSGAHSMFGYFNNDFIGIAGGSPVAEIATEVALATSVGDLIELTLTKQALTVTVTGRNVTTAGSTVQTSYTYNLSTVVEPLTPNTGRFCIGTRGSTFSVSEFYIYSSVVKNAVACLVGDSITEGYGASTYAKAFARKVNVSYPTTIMHAGENDTSAAVVLRLPQLIELSPTNVILSIGVNDFVYSIPLATIMANIATIVSSLESNGIVVYHLLNYATGTSTLRTAIQAAYPTSYIDPLTSDSNYFLPDLTHYNDYGHTAVYNAISASGFIGTPIDPAIDPFSLTPLAYWDNGGSYMAADGSQWTDRMGNYNLTAAGAARPTLTPGALNGLSSYSFNGTSQVLSGARITQIQNASSFTFWFVGRRCAMTHYTSGTIRTEFVHNIDNLNYGIVANSTLNYGTHARTNAFNYSVIVFDGTQTGNANRLRMWTNGFENVITFTGTIPAATENDVSSIIRLGRFAGGFIAGESLEHGIITRALTPEQVEGVGFFLKNKYAL